MRGFIDLFSGVPTSSDAILEYVHTVPLSSLTTEGAYSRTFKLRRPYTRQLHDTANVISVPQELYGEYIKPKSFRLTDDSTDSTIILEDDGRGNIYDVKYSSSFSSALLKTTSWLNLLSILTLKSIPKYFERT